MSNADRDRAFQKLLKLGTRVAAKLGADVPQGGEASLAALIGEFGKSLSPDQAAKIVSALAPAQTLLLTDLLNRSAPSGPTVARRDLLPMSSVPGRCLVKDCDHDRHAAADQGLIQPGQMLPITVWPVRLVRPSILRVAPSCAAHFTIDEVRCDSRSMMPVSQSIPASRFSADHGGGEWVLDRCDADTPLIMYVTNTSAEPRTFFCTWECDELPRGKYIVHDAHTWLSPGQRVTIVARSQIPGVKPRHLYIPPAIAQHFQIDEVRVGPRLQGADVGAIPAAKFGHGAGAPYTCDPLGVAMDFAITVTNTSSLAHAFVAVWACDHATQNEILSHDSILGLAETLAEKMRTTPTTPAAETPITEAQRRELMVGWYAIVGGTPRPDLFKPVPADRFVALTRDPTRMTHIGCAVPVKEPSRALDYDIRAHMGPISALGTLPDRREPVADRKDRKDPPSFGWDPWGAE